MNSIIVVEGVHDVARIKELYKDAYVVITDGSKVKESLLNQLQELAKTNQIIVFTDPDYSGERIRKIIEEKIPNVSHAFLPKYKCISKNKKKVGIEHASLSDIKEALENIYVPTKTGNITFGDLYDLNLVGSDRAGILRNEVALYLNIGITNAKTFLNRINSFGISKEELGDVICKIKEGNLKN